MKARKDVVTDAALVFTTKLPRRASQATILDSVLPETAQSLNEVTPFDQKTVPPRGMLKTFVSSLIVRILTKRATIEQVLPLLVSTERDYVLNVLDEVYAWAEM